MVRRELLAALVVVVLIALSAAPAAGRKDHVGDFEVLATVIKELEDNYATEVDSNALFYGALRGMLSVLDPHTVFLGPEAMEELRTDISGHFGGLGIVIELDANRMLTVVSPIEGTPAYKAGVAAGDKILEIDGESTRGITLREAVKVLRGKPGTTVTIKVLHPWTETLADAEDIVVERADIKVPSVRGYERDADDNWDYMIDKENKIGYIRLMRFSENSPRAVREAADILLADGMKAMIFDLRYNPGGVLQGAVRISDLFIRKGIIVETRGRLPSENRPFTARAPGTLPDFPMIVMVNEGSASASEIVAGALQDHGRAIILGERSFGKGSVQRVKSVEELMMKYKKLKRRGVAEGETDFLKCGLKITTARYYTPNGRTFDRRYTNVGDRLTKEFVRNLKRNRDDPDAKAELEALAEEMRGGIVPDIEVIITDEERKQWVKSRSKAAIIHSPKENPKEDAEDDGAEKAEKFVDKQLEEALKVLREKIAG